MCLWAVPRSDSGDKVSISLGIAEEQAVGGEDINDWGAYTALNLATLTPQATEHKSKSYWNVSSRSDRLEFLDEGRILKTAIDWYSGYNQGGGFQAPWIINKASGWKIGGHAFAMTGVLDQQKPLRVSEQLRSRMGQKG